MAKKRNPRELSKKTIPQLQKVLWPLISRYVKLNHSKDGRYNDCFTCDNVMEIGTIQNHCGHFLPRTYSPTKYQEDNLRPTCSSCNTFYGGRPVEYERNLRLEIGDERVEELKRMSVMPWKWDRFYLIDKIEYYKAELKTYE